LVLLRGQSLKFVVVLERVRKKKLKCSDFYATPIIEKLILFFWCKSKLIEVFP